MSGHIETCDVEWNGGDCDCAEVWKEQAADAHDLVHSLREEIERLTRELAEARTAGSIVAVDGTVYSLQERYDCNTALLHARTKTMGEYRERMVAAEAEVGRLRDVLRTIAMGEYDADLTRLRAVEAAAREFFLAASAYVVEVNYDGEKEYDGTYDALRAALAPAETK